MKLIYHLTGEYNYKKEISIPPVARERGGGGAFWMVNKYFNYISLNHIYHLQRQLILHINKYIKVFSDKPERMTGSVKREIMAFQLLFPFSFILKSVVFHEDEVSSLNKPEGSSFAQRHSFMKATYRRKY